MSSAIVTSTAPSPTEAFGTLRRRTVLALFATALCVRIAALLVWDAPSASRLGLWEWGYEAACIAQSIHDGHGFANTWTHAAEPWNAGSSATAWLPPVYPAFIAAVFALTGGLTSTAAAIVLSVQCVLSAATVMLVARLGARLHMPRAGLVAGWILALSPTAVWNAAHTVWDTTFTSFCVVAFAWLVCALGRDRRIFAWAGLGLAFGAMLLVNPAPLVFAPGVAYCAWRWHGTRAAASRVALFAVCAALATVPWMWRNQRAVGTFALRSNLGVELDVGNNDLADGRYQRALHPSHGPRQFEEYRALGEVAYVREADERARTWIARNSERFARLCVQRAFAFWVGIDPIQDTRVTPDEAPLTDPRSWIKYLQHAAIGAAGWLGLVWLARTRPEGVLLASGTALFSLPYVVTHVLERYRFPIEPLLVLGFAVLVLAWRESRSSRARVE